MRTSQIALSLSVLMLSQTVFAGLAIASNLESQQDILQSILIAQADTPQATTTGDGVTTYTSASTPNADGAASTSTDSSKATPQKVDTENWPWMNKEKASPSGNAAADRAKTGSVEKSAPLKMEQPVTATTSPKTSAEAAQKPKSNSTASSSKPLQLFGRIEQLSGSAGAAFPTLKALTPQMDPRGVQKLQARASDARYSGNIVKSFPTDYQGTWGGDLQLQIVQIDPVYYQIDPMEARRTQQALRVGSTGAVNFQFQNLAGGRVALEPARVMFMVPSSETEVGAQMDQMFGQGGANNPMAAMMKQMVGNISVPVMLEFGDVNTSAHSAMGEVGVSGNQVRSTVLRNVIRQLAQNVLEQQIVTQSTTWNKQTGQPRTSYGETVVRFTSRDPQTMYVQAATVSYGANKHFLDKVVLGGWVQKGVIKNTNPMSAIGGGMPGMGGMGGMGDIQKMLGQPGAGGGGMPQIPGLDPNMFKNLLGQ